MIEGTNTFDTNSFFSGGAGFFIQYHDILKPVYLYAVVKMILTGNTYGLPTNIISNMSILSILEWYQNRRYVNPFKQLDWANKIDQKDLDALMINILNEDPSIYKLAPQLNFNRMLYVYRQQHMSFPFFIYGETFEQNLKADCDAMFGDIKHKYVYGDLKDSISKCDQNFTYIFSDIELGKKAAEILTGAYAHILIASDYRYNYTDYKKTFRYDLKELMMNHPFTRIGTTRVMDLYMLSSAFKNISQGGD